MSNTVIKVENLGKKYLLAHKQTQKYIALRDVLVARAKHWGKKLFNSSIAETQSSSEREEFWALKDVSFDIKQGERVGIIGRNGAGKSTLLKILSRITEPSTGKVSIKGRIASLLEVGTGFHPELTGRENIYLNGAILGMSRAEIKKNFDAIVDFAEVEKFLDTPVKHYSSGMYVRLAFAVAAHLETEILLVDEVLAVGDAEFQKKCMGKMDEISNSQGRTILFVSHNMGAVRSLCDKAVVLSDGQLVFQGLVKDAVSKYIVQAQSFSSIKITKNMHAPRERRYVSFCSVIIKNDQEVLTTQFYMGESISLELELECIQAVDRLELGVSIRSSYDIPIHYYTSSWEGFLLTLKEGVYRVQVDIPKILVLPGKYILSCWASRDGDFSDDYVPVITMIDVDEKDLKGYLKENNLLNTYSKYTQSGTEVYADSRWKLI